MVLYVDEQIVYQPMPLYHNKKIIITIDSSKTNSGIVIADQNGNVLNVVEMNGSGVGTSEAETLMLCHDERKALTILLQGSKPQLVGIENIITKKEGKGSSHLDIHEVRFKITAIFMSFISFFQDTFNITPELINNWAWKSAVLPEDLRRENIHKGSTLYLKRINSKWANCSDDVTDAICMLMYLCITHNIKKGIQIEDSEILRFDFKYYITNTTYPTKYRNKLFIPNSELSRYQNNVVIANSIDLQEFGICNIPISDVTVDELYEKAAGKFDKYVEEVSIVVKRAS